MNPVLTRMAAWTAAGRGVEPLMDALHAGVPLRRPVPWAAEGLRSPFAALTDAPDADTLLEEVVREVMPAEGGCGLVVATTSGRITSGFADWFRAGADPDAEEAWRQAPGLAVARRLGLAPVTTVSVACASGTAAFAVARGWLRDGRCARVIVAGVDKLSLFVHAGFAGLGALAAERPRPFAPDRDGLLLGEGAAAVLLEPPGGPRPAICALLGVGLAQDAVHFTAPDRTGAGLLRAARMAMGDVAADAVGAVSGHVTSTPFNDAMEARALDALFAGPVPLHACKPVLGHTMGAAGVIETVALAALLAGAEPPPPLPPGDCPVRLGPTRAPRYGLKLSAAFGGLDAALLLGPEAPGNPRPVGVRAAERHEVSGDHFPLEALGAPPTLGRADTYVRAGIAALRPLPLGPATAVVLASTTNCRAADHRYYRDLLARGPAGAPRVHFAYTVPGSPLGEASILRRLHGPGLVLCAPADEADEEARRLVRWGLAPDAVALTIEAPDGPATARAVRYAGDP